MLLSTMDLTHRLRTLLAMRITAEHHRHDNGTSQQVADYAISPIALTAVRALAADEKAAERAEREGRTLDDPTQHFNRLMRRIHQRAVAEERLAAEGEGRTPDDGADDGTIRGTQSSEDESEGPGARHRSKAPSPETACENRSSESAEDGEGIAAQPPRSSLLSDSPLTTLSRSPSAPSCIAQPDDSSQRSTSCASIGDTIVVAVEPLVPVWQRRASRPTVRAQEAVALAGVVQRATRLGKEKRLLPRRERRTRSAVVEADRVEQRGKAPTNLVDILAGAKASQ